MKMRLMHTIEIHYSHGEVANHYSTHRGHEAKEIARDLQNDCPRATIVISKAMSY